MSDQPVVAMLRDNPEWDADTVLRNAHARLSAAHANGLDPKIVVIMVSEGHLPSITYSGMRSAALAEASARLQLEVMLQMQEDCVRSPEE